MSVLLCTILYHGTSNPLWICGSVRQKNVKNTMLQNILDACGGVGFWSVGYAFAYGSSGSGTVADKRNCPTCNNIFERLTENADQPKMDALEGWILFLGSLSSGFFLGQEGDFPAHSVDSTRFYTYACYCW